jgi:hypothetical protein
MNTRTKIASVAVLSSALAGLTVSVAAPKQSMQQKWEYCTVQGTVRTVQGDGIQIYLPHGKQSFHKAALGGLKAYTQVLNGLGNQGWEIVGADSSKGQVWILKRKV